VCPRDGELPREPRRRRWRLRVGRAVGEVDRAIGREFAIGDGTDEPLRAATKDRRKPCDRSRDLASPIDDAQSARTLDEQQSPIRHELDRVAVGDAACERLRRVRRAHGNARCVRLARPLGDWRVSVWSGRSGWGCARLLRRRTRNGPRALRMCGPRECGRHEKRQQTDGYASWLSRHGTPPVTGEV